MAPLRRGPQCCGRGHVGLGALCRTGRSHASRTSGAQSRPAPGQSRHPSRQSHSPVTPPTPGQAVLPFGNAGGGGTAGQASHPNFSGAGVAAQSKPPPAPVSAKAFLAEDLDDARRLDRWWWSVPLWTPADHESWKQAMTLAWQGHLKMNSPIAAKAAPETKGKTP
jgi:hypothetical protein